MKYIVNILLIVLFVYIYVFVKYFIEDKKDIIYKDIVGANTYLKKDINYTSIGDAANYMDKNIFYTLEINRSFDKKKSDKLFNLLKEKKLDVYMSTDYINNKINYKIKYGIYINKPKAIKQKIKLKKTHNIESKIKILL
jgi:hypothetical protein